MAYRGSRSSSSRSYSKPSTRTSYGTAKAAPKPKVIVKQKVVYRNAPSKSYYGYDNSPSMGSSLANGAAQGFGAGAGFAVADDLLGNDTPQVVQAPPQVVYQNVPQAQMPQQMIPQAGMVQQPQMYMPQQEPDSGFGFGSFVLLAMLGVGAWFAYKKWFA